MRSESSRVATCGFPGDSVMAEDVCKRPFQKSQKSSARRAGGGEGGVGVGVGMGTRGRSHANAAVTIRPGASAPPGGQAGTKN